LVTLFILVISIDASALKTTDKNNQEKPNGFLGLKEGGAIPSPSESGDLDPLVDLAVTVTIKEIRALGKIDLIGEADFYVKVIINDVEHTSPVWRNQKHVESNWSVTQDVPDDKEFVNITIQLWDWNVGLSKICDISPISEGVNYMDEYDVDLMYSLKSGHWTGDDYNYPTPDMFDPSGYGRLNGCDDNSIYQNDRDCELWFDVTQNDYDGDGIPYWTEVNVFGTDPTVNNRGWDNDSDGVPIEWEFKWGHYFEYDWHHGTVENKWIYDPFVWDDHRHLDPDEDGLDNIEEYLTSQWGSDPFRKDLFIELDQMEDGPDGLMVQFPKESKELMTTAYNSRNIVLHLDDGSLGGGELIPFTEEILTRDDLSNYYFQYFLHGDINNWRAGVFHYALNVYDAGWAGYVFDNGYTGHLDSVQISSKYHENFTIQNPLYNLVRRKTFNIQSQREMLYAAVLMHEVGHTLGIFRGNTPGCDNGKTVNPLQYNYWKYGPYQSVMNYRYVYSGLVDYSDGSRGKNDFDDWGRIDLTLFQGDW
jgi:hypothetical protein